MTCQVTIAEILSALEATNKNCYAVAIQPGGPNNTEYYTFNTIDGIASLILQKETDPITYRFTGDNYMIINGTFVLFSSKEQRLIIEIVLNEQLKNATRVHT